MDESTVGMSTNLDSASQLTSFGLPQGLGQPRQPVDTIALQNVRAEVRTSKVMIVDDDDMQLGLGRGRRGAVHAGLRLGLDAPRGGQFAYRIRLCRETEDARPRRGGFCGRDFHSC